MKKNWETVERTIVIIGAILGVVSFCWQIYDTVEQQRQKVTVEMTFAISKGDLPIELKVEVINNGQRPVYIKKVLIQEVIMQSSSGKPIGTHSLVTFVEDNIQAEPIQPGQSREYSEQISIDSIISWLSFTRPINLLVESPTQTLINKDIIKECLGEVDYWIKYTNEEKDGEFPFQYSCTPK